METPPLLDLRDVCYEVGGKRIVDRVNWRVERGQHWALLGRNGAGKTTLLEIACGYKWPNAGGTVLRNGRAQTDLRELRRSIGWVTSTLVARIPAGETVFDTVVSGRFAAMGLKRFACKRPASEDYRDAEGILDRLGIGSLARRPFGVLSQGEKQKTLLARAQMAGPLLTILDEPCAGLDPASRECFLAAVQEMAASRDTPSFVLVTHHVDEIVPAFSRTLAIDDGRVVRSGPTRQILDKPLIDALYEGSVDRLIWNGGRCWPICR